MTHDETYAMLAFFASRGGVCDCEIVMNCDFILSFAYVKPSSTIEHDMSSLDAIVVLLDHNSPPPDNMKVKKGHLNVTYEYEEQRLVKEIFDLEDNDFWEAFIFDRDGNYAKWTTSEI